jgi:hypothetical protein
VLLHHGEHAVLNAVTNTRAILPMSKVAVVCDLLLVRRNVVTANNSARQRAKLEVHGLIVDPEMCGSGKAHFTFVTLKRFNFFVDLFAVLYNLCAPIALVRTLGALE